MATSIVNANAVITALSANVTLVRIGNLRILILHYYTYGTTINIPIADRPLTNSAGTGVKFASNASYVEPLRVTVETNGNVEFQAYNQLNSGSSGFHNITNGDIVDAIVMWTNE